MSWTPDELDRIGAATELRVASRRADGTLRPWVTIWVAREGTDVYIRSARGADNPWFRRARTSGSGRIEAGGVSVDVRFMTPPDGAHPLIDEVLHAKYDRYGPGPVGAITGPETYPSTLRLDPCRE